MSSYKSQKSKHILNARKIYKIQNITPNEELARKTGCTISALNEIVKKTARHEGRSNIFSGLASIFPLLSGNPCVLLSDGIYPSLFLS